MLKTNRYLIILSFLVILFILSITITLALSDSSAEEPSNIEETTSIVLSTEETTVLREPEPEPLINQPELYPDLTYEIYYEPVATEAHIAIINAAADELANIDYSKYTQTAAKAMSTEVLRLLKIAEQMTFDLAYYKACEEEFYYATKVWEFLRQQGFNNEVTCAIIGNMMVETSGGSLDLDPANYSSSGNYFGLCQWSLKYYPETKDISFEEQLDYLLNTMPWEFDTFGKIYKRGFDYEDFTAMTNVEEAALAFAKSYERCRPTGYNYKMRQLAAVKAYEYFNFD